MPRNGFVAQALPVKLFVEGRVSGIETGSPMKGRNLVIGHDGRIVYTSL